MQKIIFCVLTVVAVCNLAGCGGKTESEQQSGASAVAGAVAESVNEPLGLTEGALPIPQLSESNNNLLKNLVKRRSQRQFNAARDLPRQLLGELLWAAYGRLPDGRKTVPAALRSYDLTIYAADRNAVYVYDADNHAVKLVKKGDFRGDCGLQDFDRDAAVVLIYVTDPDKFVKITDSASRRFYAATHAGFSIQNIYLYAAEHELATVVCGSVNRAKLSEILKVAAKNILYIQPVGYPADLPDEP